MLRYALGFAIAAIGGVGSQIAADAIGATGLAAYGVFLAFVAVFAPAAAIVSGSPPRRRMARTHQR